MRFKIWLVALLCVFAFGARADTALQQRLGEGCFGYTLCAAEITTGACAGTTEIVADLRGIYAQTVAYVTKSTASAYSCDVFSGDNGFHASHREQLNSAALTAGQATETLSVPAVVANTETVTIDTKVYTFQTSLTNVDGNVLIGADSTASVANLNAAVNLGAGAGTTYAAAMTLHPTVSTMIGSPVTDLDAFAKSYGTGGDSIVTTETLDGASNQWGAGTLSGGVNAVPRAPFIGLLKDVWAECTVITRGPGNGAVTLEFYACPR